MPKFGGFVYAKKDGQVAIRPVALISPDKDSAKVDVLNNAMTNLFPVSEGWGEYFCDVVEVPNG